MTKYILDDLPDYFPGENNERNATEKGTKKMGINRCGEPFDLMLEREMATSALIEQLEKENARLMSQNSAMLKVLEAERDADLWDDAVAGKEVTKGSLVAIRKPIFDKWSSMIDGHLNDSNQLRLLAKSLRKKFLKQWKNILYE